MTTSGETRQSHLEDTGILWCATHGRMLPPSFSHRCHADDPEPCDVRRLLVSDSGGDARGGQS